MIIIPAFNEEETLPSVLASLAEELPDMDVVVVDDGSGDATATVARQAGATVLRLPFNLGIGGALRTGFRYAVTNDYDRAVQLDADGQHDPALITRLLDELDHADLVIGSRFATESDYEVGSTRKGAMGMLRFALRVLSGRTFTDTSSGFRAFDRQMLEFFATNYPSEYMESVEALLSACQAGFEVVEVPVTMQQRLGGQASNRSLKLAYHYTRLMVALLSMATFKRNRPSPSPTVEARSLSGAEQ